MNHHMKLKAAALAVGLLVVAMPALAQDCGAEVLDQQTMNACARQDWEEADARLNEVWRQVMARIKVVDATESDGKVPISQLLREAQRAWIEFRDKACLAESAPMRGGSAEPLLFWGCMAAMTRDRTDQLEAFGEMFEY